MKNFQKIIEEIMDFSQKKVSKNKKSPFFYLIRNFFINFIENTMLFEIPPSTKEKI